MEILFFHTPHFRLNLISQIELEIILTHLKNGDTVYVISCADGRELGHCVTNLKGRGDYCHTCTKTQSKIYDIARRHGNLFTYPYLPLSTKVQIPTFSSVNDLKKHKYKDVNIGYGVASVVISQLRDHGFDIKKYSRRIKSELAQMIQVIDTIEKYCFELRPDIVYSFNGRMSQYAAVVEWCRANNQAFRVFEFTSRRDAYRILNGTTPHDVAYAMAEIEKYWNDQDVSKEQKMKIGSGFFENTRQGISMLEENFISAQKDGELPLFDSSKEIVTFFNSSIDEFAAVPGWEEYMYVFSDETDAILQICEHYKDDVTKQFILRIHPNLKFQNNTQIRDLTKLYNLENLIIVEPTSKISSYTLLEKSDKIITFGSTLGVEATYFGKPSILLGLSFYQNLDAAYIPDNKLALYQLIDQRDLSPKPQQNAVKFGYWWVTFGEAFNHRNITYQTTEIELTLNEKLGVVARKIFSFDLLLWIPKLFKFESYQKLKDKRYQQSLVKEFMPWNKK